MPPTHSQVEAMRIGIVGQRGRAFAGALCAVPWVELTALCNIDSEALHAQADALEIPERFERFSDMLGHVDAVVVSTPMQLHAVQSIAALEAGVHVLSEVTAAVSIDECWQLKRAAQRAAKHGIVYAMAENYCYIKHNVLIKELLHAVGCLASCTSPKGSTCTRFATCTTTQMAHLPGATTGRWALRAVLTPHTPWAL
ncbi:MAG: Gfo/Idh/MocA family oxidoreductase [Armatimonas sp.]